MGELYKQGFWFLCRTSEKNLPQHCGSLIFLKKPQTVALKNICGEKCVVLILFLDFHLTGSIQEYSKPVSPIWGQYWRWLSESSWGATTMEYQDLLFCSKVFLTSFRNEITSAVERCLGTLSLVPVFGWIIGHEGMRAQNTYMCVQTHKQNHCFQVSLQNMTKYNWQTGCNQLKICF